METWDWETWNQKNLEPQIRNKYETKLFLMSQERSNLCSYNITTYIAESLNVANFLQYGWTSSRHSRT